MWFGDAPWLWRLGFTKKPLHGGETLNFELVGDVFELKSMTWIGYQKKG